MQEQRRAAAEARGIVGHVYGGMPRVWPAPAPPPSPLPPVQSGHVSSIPPY
jgi:hypothetical protein